MSDFRKYKSGSIRIKDFDYGSVGDYFITICSHNREYLFGEIRDGEMVLNEMGKIVEEEIINTPKIRKNIGIDIFCVMPNHIHLVITVFCRDTLQRVSTIERFGQPTSNTIPTIIRLIKSATTKRINILRNTPSQPVFQRGFYEHIIRNEKSYDEIYSYIESNPSTWYRDRNNPENSGK